MRGVHLLYKLFEGDLRKSYGEKKTNLNSTNNTSIVPQENFMLGSFPKLYKAELTTIGMRGAIYGSPISR
jgi:hypothetical protein